MSSYFPYSQIIDSITNTIIKHPYFNGWSISGNEPKKVEIKTVAISEIYY